MIFRHLGVICHRVGHYRRILLLGIFVISIFLYFSLELEISKVDSPDLKEVITDSEVHEILINTPYLWRKFVFTENETLSTRIENQKLWIQKLSKTNYIKTARTKTILVQQRRTDEFYHTGNQIKCPYAPEFESKCNIVEDKWFYFGAWKYRGMDAVVSARNWETHSSADLPASTKQILYILEPPYIAKNADLGQGNALLASYYKGSDIPIPYRRWIPHKNPQSFNVETKELDALISGRNKMVVAMISNCDKGNDRLGFIAELQKYVEVDVFGRCGNFSCPRGQHGECLAKMRKEYKFYISAENSNCVDYITEKFFDNGLQNDLVPIVMGAPPEDYVREGPPNSFIAVNDFASPKDLADFLHMLNSDEDLYKSYFKWKHMGKIESVQHLEDFFCRVCSLLHYADFVPPPTWNSTFTTWRDVNYCLPQGQWYWPSS